MPHNPTDQRDSSSDFNPVEADRVIVENVNKPGQTTWLDARMYQAMRQAMLQVLPTNAPGLTQEEMCQQVISILPDELFPGGAKSGWWSKTVQLDLEAMGVITREPTRPLHWHRQAPFPSGEG